MLRGCLVQRDYRMSQSIQNNLRHSSWLESGVRRPREGRRGVNRSFIEKVYYVMLLASKLSKRPQPATHFLFCHIAHIASYARIQSIPSGSSTARAYPSLQFPQNFIRCLHHHPPRPPTIQTLVSARSTLRALARESSGLGLRRIGEWDRRAQREYRASLVQRAII